MNIKDWCKNDFEVVNQFRINTENSHQLYDVIFLINGLPLVQIELKAFQLSPRKTIQQIVDYKNETGNSYTYTLFCFMQLFIVSNGNDTLYCANNRKNTSVLMQRSGFCPFIGMPIKIITR
ncbi:MAG: type I restriction endonuclease [Candidatus Phlomobacter fragariae]